MKINWFSPLPPAKTEIAQHTMRLISALQGKFEINLWTDQPEWHPEIEKIATVQYFSEGNVDWTKINSADVNIYNIGNNSDFHLLIWKISKIQPGIVVLHDTHLHHMFCIYFSQLQNKSHHAETMKKYYGEDGLRALEAYWSTKLSMDDLAEKFPLTPLAIEKALAVIVHTRSAVAAIKGISTVPVCYAPLPMDAGEPPARSDNKNLKIQLVTFGFIGPNRRVESILAALAQLEHPERFHLDICGQLWDEKYIFRFAEEHGVRECITYHGFVTDEILDDILDNADLAINLRYPTMGEASASQLRIWKHAVPSVVTKVGWYAEIPEVAVKFVQPESEVEDLKNLLERMLDDPSHLKGIGVSGRILLADEHSPANYADRLEKLLEGLPKMRARRCALDLAVGVGRAMDQLSDNDQSLFLPIVARHIQKIAG